MPDEVDLTTIFGDAAFRRLWLVRKAMECAPLDRAIELARIAEEFVTDSGSQRPPAQPALDAPKLPERPVEAVIGKPRMEAQASEPRTGLVLSAEQRERLLDRLAKGARNAELATEFGLSPRQVQGVRMGSAREIAERRNRLPDTASSASGLSQERAVPEDIVRFLRQQDDIVVPQADGDFLVNGRFRLALPELVSRANKMRHRQGKPEFRLNIETAVQDRVRPATRHPIFWEQEAGSERTSPQVN